MIATLPMYARASNKGAHDIFWNLVRDGLRALNIATPDALDHNIDHKAGWQRNDLVLGHICNLPYRAQFKDKVTLIGASDYGLNDCPPGYYRSAFIVRADTTIDLETARFVCNDMLSQSGYGAAQIWAKSQGFQFRLHTQTGSHHASINAVATGQADIAAIDMQSWRIEYHENPMCQRVKIIGYTDPSPGQTFITRAGEDPAPYFDAINDAIIRLDAQNAKILGLKGIVALPAHAYDLPIPAEVAQIAG